MIDSLDWSVRHGIARHTDYLRRLYYSPGNPGAFAGPKKLYQAVKQDGKHTIGRMRIRQFLNNEHPYILLKPIRRSFPRSKVIVNIDGDLADVSNIASTTDGYKYFLALIDICSRFLFIVPLKISSTRTSEMV